MYRVLEKRRGIYMSFRVTEDLDDDHHLFADGCVRLDRPWSAWRLKRVRKLMAGKAARKNRAVRRADRLERGGT